MYLETIEQGKKERTELKDQLKKLREEKEDWETEKSLCKQDGKTHVGKLSDATQSRFAKANYKVLLLGILVFVFYIQSTFRFYQEQFNTAGFKLNALTDLDLITSFETVTGSQLQIMTLKTVMRKLLTDDGKKESKGKEELDLVEKFLSCFLCKSNMNLVNKEGCKMLLCTSSTAVCSPPFTTAKTHLVL
ncbi:hypothetical protein ACROYT_G014577 [Oculina patagonica]